MRLSWFIANRIGKAPRSSASKRRLSGTGNIISITSVAISIAVIIIAVAVSKGFGVEIREKAAGFCGDLLISSPAGSIKPIGCEEKILALPYVSRIQAISYRPCILKTEDQIQGAVIKGVDSSYDWKFFESSLSAGYLPSSADSSEVIISGRIAKMLRLGAGDKLTAYFIGEDIRVRRLKISGIYSAQLEEYDKFYIIGSRTLVNELNDWDPDELSNYEVLFKDHSERSMDQRRREVATIIYSEEGAPFVSVTGLKENVYRLIDWLHLLDTNMLIVLILMIAVAGFNMISCILIILFENISTIGVFKTMGMSNKGVKEVFMAKACKIVLYGLLIGNIFALLLCYLQRTYHLFSLNPDNYFLSYIPIELSVTGVLLPDVLSFVVIMLLLLIPCHFINKITPAQAVRIE